jgi:signal transduction histidine kinase
MIPTRPHDAVNDPVHIAEPASGTFRADLATWLASPEVGKTDPRAKAFEVFPVPALIIGTKGQIVASNAAASDLFGTAPALLAGVQCWELLTARDAARERDETRPFTAHTARGDRPIILRGLPLALVGDPAPMLLLLESERAPAVDARTEDRLLLLDVAHELRSPLHSFNLALSGLVGATDGLTETDRQKLVGALQRSSIHLQTLVENLLDSASLGASQFSVVPDSIDLSTVIRESVLMVDPLLTPNKQRIVVDLPYEPLVVMADAQRLRQVLVNLLHNAIKYGPKQERIKVRARRKHGEILVKVTDRGPGIPEAEHSRLFERFYRGQAAAAAGHGNGLGLSIARATILAHGGAIGVRNEPKVGTTFWFTLRVRK